jgi:hypothetical protein
MPVVAFIVASLKEMARTRVYVGVLATGCILIALSLVLTELAPYAEGRTLLDLGLALTSLVSVVLATVVPVSVIAREIRSRDVVSYLTRPVPRWSYIVGRFLAVILLVLLTNVLFGLLLGGLLVVRGAGIAFVGFVGPLWQSLECCVLAALAVFFGVRSSPAVSAVFVSLLFVAGRLSVEFRDAIPRLPEGGRPLARAVWRVLPDLGAYDLTPLAHGAEIGTGALAASAAVALLQTSALLLLAVWRLERRQYF